MKMHQQSSWSMVEQVVVDQQEEHQMLVVNSNGNGNSMEQLTLVEVVELVHKQVDLILLEQILEEMVVSGIVIYKSTWINRC